MFAVTAGFDVTDADGGLEPASAESVREFPVSPSPPAVHISEPAEPCTCSGLQMKKSTVPVGVPPAVVPVTTALSKTDVPTATGPVMLVPAGACGDVTVLVVSGLTVTHSECLASLDVRYVLPLGV